MDTYSFTKDRLIALGYAADEIERLAKAISESPKIEIESFKAFNEAANKLPWPQDHDFGALALQKWSILASSIIAKEMIRSAIARAEYCARCSTSGSEGLARSEHVRELKRELEKCN